MEGSAMTRSVIGSLCVMASLLWTPSGASPQSRGLEMFPRDRLNEQSGWPGPPVRELYPARPAVPDEPAFIAPLSKETATGRAGIAGWAAPNVPAGSRGAADPDNPGWLGFGFAWQWGASTGRARN
jgi:hypothetical protein